MFLLLAVILVILWAGGFFLFHVTSFFIHILLIFAVISLIVHFVSGRRAV
ncbi:MAG: lmo0937 family membrane protein [Acidobacteriaceae bacterium]